MDENWHIRPVTLDDAEALATFFKALDLQAKYMLPEPNERTRDTKEQFQLLTRFQNNPRQNMLLAISEDTIAGFIVGTGGVFRKNRHVLQIVMGVLKHYQGQGIGTALMESLIYWAHMHEFQRLELSVVTKNKAAIHLYQKFGFEKEGLKRSALQINHQFLDEWYMARLLAKSPHTDPISEHR